MKKAELEQELWELRDKCIAQEKQIKSQIETMQKLVDRRNELVADTEAMRKEAEKKTKVYITIERLFEWDDDSIDIDRNFYTWLNKAELKGITQLFHTLNKAYNNILKISIYEEVE